MANDKVIHDMRFKYIQTGYGMIQTFQYENRIIFTIHYIKDYCNKNSMLITIFRSSMCNASWQGRNIRDVCFKNGIDLHSLYTMCIGEIQLLVNGVNV